MKRVTRRWLLCLIVLLSLGLLPISGSATEATTVRGPAAEERALQPVSAAAAAAIHAQALDAIENETIFGPDERVRLSPAYAAAPLLVLFDATEQPIAACTGTFVGPQTIATAAHCLYNTDFGGFIWGVVVASGADGENLAYEPVAAARAWVPQEWADGEDRGDTEWAADFALLYLESPATGNAVGWHELHSMTTSSLLSPTLGLETIGYPGDKPFATQWRTQQAALLDADAAFLYHQLDLYQGQSGSATFRASDRKIVGIVSAESSTFNLSNRVRPDMIGFFNGVCEGVAGCWVAWSEEGTAPPPPPPPTGDAAFQRTWERTDKPVADGIVSRTWMWGPQMFIGSMTEDYAEAPGGQRAVMYYDKCRMEITNPNGDANSIWYVTNGLLVTEMVTGQMQTGDSQFVPRGAAQVNVAGDADQADGVTYAQIGAVRWEPAAPQGAQNTLMLTPGGIVNEPRLAQYGVYGAQYVAETNHTVAGPFWAFMNQQGVVYQNGGFTNDQLFQNPFYATGYPIAEAYWANVKVGGVYRDVLIQCFERRCLTYTPGNPPGWDVEAGNVGQHYYAWRYGQ